ncbi:MAG: SRPBCC domain-containing protein [Deltaproteobacteria bacterium]|nr:SRPBCC domain-containing protein [Deltaproteobacteria bacterium]
MSTARTLARKATAIADLDSGLVLARVEIAVPPARVFTALTTDELTQWWGAPEMYRTTAHAIDLRVGGAWRSSGVGADGHTFHVGGEVLAVEAPHTLVYTWKPSWDDGPATTVSYRLDAIPGGTRVTVRHTGFTNPAVCGDHATGWERVFGWLGDHLAAD